MSPLLIALIAYLGCSTGVTVVVLAALHAASLHDAAADRLDRARRSRRSATVVALAPVAHRARPHR